VCGGHVWLHVTPASRVRSDRVRLRERLHHVENTRDIAEFWWQKIAGKNASLMGMVKGPTPPPTVSLRKVVNCSTRDIGARRCPESRVFPRSQPAIGRTLIRSLATTCSARTDETACSFCFSATHSCLPLEYMYGY